ncbi:hypothetical protein G7076_02575 [Sphingomonas sp. HDW15A]|uniref:hypothetical protein n=1 Tax=Sphingomonas sp. HDW15A TaxID=2714942 RepID=UPI00140E179C|nr:hypothetical protein [Sphingomonas sp. HDW15A]QIK95513.1 hypothetical protein G7076_02575 [Sphingomonas sp. HDW15A]
MTRTPADEHDRLREILDAIESGEIVIKQATDEVIQEIERRMTGFDDSEVSAA